LYDILICKDDTAVITLYANAATNANDAAADYDTAVDCNTVTI
jgi:hypothetical protein